jgi:hypothetical protein
LTEVLFVTALTSLIIAMGLPTLVASIRLFEATVADIELSLQSRSLREKLLYHVDDGASGEGGLMNSEFSQIQIPNPNAQGKGRGLRFKPRRGPPNRLTVNNRRIRADRGNARWLTAGRIAFRSDEVFSFDSDPGIVMVSLDLSLQIGSRMYTHQDEMVVQIMNP